MPRTIASDPHVEAELVRIFGEDAIS
jgi:hypothetical protein